MDAPTLARVLELADSDKPVAEIAADVKLTQGRVYAVLREHRPDRKRSPRPCTSDLPAKIKILFAEKIKPARIAVLLDVSRAYVYRHL